MACSKPGSCSNSNKVVVPLVASLGGGFVILATTITSFFIFKRHRVTSEMGNLRAYSRIKMELESNKQQFSYVEGCGKRSIWNSVSWLC
ncbi:hypothetical protein HN51_040591, partial [Arachis hypogaea]